MKVAVIGAGAMGTAIAAGAAAAQPGRWSFSFYDPQAGAAKRAAAAVGGEVAASAEMAMCGADIVLLAVKPQIQSRVLSTLPPLGGAALVSIAAGRTLAAIETDLAAAGQRGAAVVRVMPNLNALVGKATSALCASAATSEQQVDLVEALFDAVGTTQRIAEPLFPAFTAMAGSSPAWFFQIVQDLARAGVKHGLTGAEATSAACSAMLGSAAMLQDALSKGEGAASLIDRVCSPGGTTIAGLLAAQEAGLGSALVKAVDATVARDAHVSGS